METIVIKFPIYTSVCVRSENLTRLCSYSVVCRKMIRINDCWNPLFYITTNSIRWTIPLLEHCFKCSNAVSINQFWNNSTPVNVYYFFDGSLSLWIRLILPKRMDKIYSFWLFDTVEQNLAANVVERHEQLLPVRIGTVPSLTFFIW